MKKTKTIFILFGLMILTVGFVNADDWFKMESNEFQIYFPREPKNDIQKLNTDVGELKINIYMYEPNLYKDDNLGYCVAVSEYPDSLFKSDSKDILPNFFRKSIDGAVNNVHGKLQSELIIEKDGNPGREIKIEIGENKAVILMRLYLVKNKMFFLQVITETKKDFNKSIDRFLDSFKLKK